MRERTDAVDGEIRPHTRRHGPRVYLTERIGTGERRALDRRGTWVRLTRRGRHLRRRVLDVLVSLDPERPAGPAHGARSNRPYFSKNE